MKYIEFGHKLLNTALITTFEVETMMGNWRIAAYIGEDLIACEPVSEECAYARLKELKEILNSQ